MASKRQRGESWEFTVKRSGLLEKPLTLTFRDEQEGDEYCRKLEALLDRGLVPDEYRPNNRVLTVADLIGRYTRDTHPSKKDLTVLPTLVPIVGKDPWGKVDADWVDQLVSRLKREERLAPSTIRAKIGALARCADWGMRKKLIILPDHPFRTLPDGYASYTADDAALAGGAKLDEERDRRLEHGEEDAIRMVLSIGILERKQRPYVIPHKDSLILLFGLALESAMRLSEMLTLEPYQVRLDQRTIHLEKTKNGDKRAVPMSSIATRLLSENTYNGNHVFPWLDQPTASKDHVKNAANHVSKVFSGVFNQAGCPDLRFHDLRHEAVSRFFERPTTLSTEEIQKISGHKTHKMLMRYLKLRSSSLVSKLW
jgi:integrase